MVKAHIAFLFVCQSKLHCVGGDYLAMSSKTRPRGVTTAHRYYTTLQCARSVRVRDKYDRRERVGV